MRMSAGALCRIGPITSSQLGANRRALSMNTRQSMWYWTEQDWLEHQEKKANQFLAELRLYTDDDVARITRYIESRGGVVGGADERESLRRALGQAGRIWLQPH